MHTLSRSSKALQILSSYVHEPLQVALEGHDPEKPAHPDTYMLLIRVASERLLEMTAADPQIMKSSRAARIWVENRRARYRTPQRGAK